MSNQQNLFDNINQLESQLFLPTDVENNQLPELRLLDFCLKKLGVKKPNLEYLPNSLLVNTIDHNDIPYRVVDTPRDLVKNAYSILIVFDLNWYISLPFCDLLVVSPCCQPCGRRVLILARFSRTFSCLPTHFRTTRNVKCRRTCTYGLATVLAGVQS